MATNAAGPPSPERPVAVFDLDGTVLLGHPGNVQSDTVGE